MGDFYWKIAKSFKVLAIISLVSGITYGLVTMLLSFSSGLASVGILTFILCIIVSIIGSAPLYVLGEVVDRIDGIENHIARTNSNVTSLRNTVNKTNENTLPYQKHQDTKAEILFYTDEELRRMGLTSLKRLYENGEISQATYDRIKSEKMSNQ